MSTDSSTKIPETSPQVLTTREESCESDWVREMTGHASNIRSEIRVALNRPTRSIKLIIQVSHGSTDQLPNDGAETACYGSRSGGLLSYEPLSDRHAKPNKRTALTDDQCALDTHKRKVPHDLAFKLNLTSTGGLSRRCKYPEITLRPHDQRYNTDSGSEKYLNEAQEGSQDRRVNLFLGRHSDANSV
jgi:hypothetical protein